MCFFDHSPLVTTHQIGPEDQPIIAWKELILRDTSWPSFDVGGFELESPYMRTRWPKGTRRVKTRAKGAISPERCQGKDGSTPGIYAYKSATACKARRTRRWGVRVKVELRGTVHEYAKTGSGWHGTPAGYRATEATIVEAVAKNDLQAERIRAAYPGLKVRVL